MEWKEKVKKYWWVGAVLIGILLLFRPKQAGAASVSRIAAVEGQKPTSDGIMEQTLQRLSLEEAGRASRIGSAQEALALQQIKSQQELEGASSQYQMSILKGQTLVQNRLTSEASKVKFQCPPGMGVAKLNPETGQMFCRAPAGGGGFKGLLNTFNQVASSIAPFFGAPALPNRSVLGGTPPIVAGGTPPFIPKSGGGAY